MAEHLLVRTGVARWVPRVRLTRRSALRTTGNLAGLLLTVFVVLWASLFIATATGAATGMIVVSGSMEPTIMTGAYVLAVPAPASKVAVGDIVSVPRKGNLPVIHRVTEVSPGPAGQTVLRLKGDANAAVDAEPYVVDEVLRPVQIVSGLGRAVMAVDNGKAVVQANPLRASLLVFGVVAVIISARALLAGARERARPRARSFARRNPVRSSSLVPSVRRSLRQGASPRHLLTTKESM